MNSWFGLTLRLINGMILDDTYDPIKVLVLHFLIGCVRLLNLYLQFFVATII